MEGIVFLPFYSREQYIQLLRIAVDSDTLFKTWEEWKSETEKVKNYLEQHEQECRYVEVSIHALVEWCSKRGIANNSSARSEFVTEEGIKLFKK
jgi:hypothetical protein